MLRDNVAELGGAFYLDDDNSRLYNTTVVQNTARSGTGGAAYGFFTNVLLRNSIVGDNGGNQFDGFALSTPAEFSYGPDLSGGLGVIDEDPLFVDAGRDDFRLQASWTSFA